MATVNEVTKQIEVPKLVSGDRLSRHEFERRYHQMPHVKKAELIEGVVRMPSPVSFEKHAEPHAFIMAWLGFYRAMTPGIRLGDNGTIRLDLDNEPQPDAFLFIESGSQAVIGDDDYVEGAPELIVEISASTVSYDMHDKMQVYRRNGVKEYLVWRIDDEAFDWFVLTDDGYERLESQSGILKSRTFMGLTLHVDALLNGDMATVLTTLQDALKSLEHREFISNLRTE